MIKVEGKLGCVIAVYVYDSRGNVGFIVGIRSGNGIEALHWGGSGLGFHLLGGYGVGLSTGQEVVVVRKLHV